MPAFVKVGSVLAENIGIDGEAKTYSDFFSGHAKEGAHKEVSDANDNAHDDKPNAVDDRVGPGGFVAHVRESLEIIIK